MALPTPVRERDLDPLLDSYEAGADFSDGGPRPSAPPQQRMDPIAEEPADALGTWKL